MRRLEGDEERLFRIADQMVPGTLRGSLASAAPPRAIPYPRREIIPRPQPIKAETAVHWVGQLAYTTSLSPRIYVKTTRVLTGLLLYCSVSGTTSTILSVLKNGAVQAAGLTLASGDGVELVTFPAVSFVAATDYLNLLVTSAGVGVVDLIADPLWETTP